MDCPKCGEKLEHEDIKHPCVVFHCECGYECDGEWFMCDVDDYEEKLYRETERMVDTGETHEDGKNREEVFEEEQGRLSESRELDRRAEG